MRRLRDPLKCGSQAKGFLLLPPPGRAWRHYFQAIWLAQAGLAFSARWARFRSLQEARKLDLFLDPAAAC